jgi:hypothetical protein
MTTLELIFATQRVISVSGDAEKKPLWGFGGPLPAVIKPKVKGGARNGAEEGSEESACQEGRQEEVVEAVRA